MCPEKAMYFQASFLHTTFLALGGPREMPYRHNEETIAVICNTSERHPPSQESRDERKESTRHEDLLVRFLFLVAVHLPNAQEQERDIHRKEQKEENNGRLHRAEHHEEGEDKPCLTKQTH